jgi:hypothetical protein
LEVTKAFSSGVSSGQPRVENGTSAEENQVSSTSCSRRSVLPGALAWASASLRATTMLPSSSYQAGIWWPHHSWRDAPVLDVVHPLVVGVDPVFRDEAHFAGFHGFDGLCAMDWPVGSPSPGLLMATNHWSVSKAR